ncbi:carbohydrate esterase family 1 protein [Gautieria morchelliformis]|nr:carbohydrate esterase family 1 protein [Gautieria morchelliformis]
MSSFEKVSSNKTFGGELLKFKFASPALSHTVAKFSVFIPGSASQDQKAPVLFYLSGLECNEDQGPQKGGFLKDAATEGISLVFPDTSPRGAGVEGEDDDWTFGTGAGFYIDATSPKYSQYYNMYTHVTFEIPHVLQRQNLPLDLERRAIFGHSMGGHGALTVYLKAFRASHTRPYLSASAFAPVSNPTQSPWGQRAFQGYLKGGIEEGKAHDATELISKVNVPVNILIDYGDGDKFYQSGQLLPENFLAAAQKAGHAENEVVVRRQPGYDHSYYFISSFASDHIKFHARFLKA